MLHVLLVGLSRTFFGQPGGRPSTDDEVDDRSRRRTPFAIVPRKFSALEGKTKFYSSRSKHEEYQGSDIPSVFLSLYDQSPLRPLIDETQCLLKVVFHESVSSRVPSLHWLLEIASGADNKMRGPQDIQLTREFDFTFGLPARSQKKGVWLEVWNNR